MLDERKIDMNNEELKQKVKKSIEAQLSRKGFITTIDVLIDINALTEENLKLWRFGKIPYLEKVCSLNLNKLTLVSKEIRNYATQNKLKQSFTSYKQFGVKGSAKPLIFSKSKSPSIEKFYSTHHVDTNKFNKEEKKEKNLK